MPAGFEVGEFAHGEGRVAVFTVRGSKRLNVVGRETLDACADGIRAMASNDEIRCAVLQGDPETAFIGGADLNELQALETHDAAGFVGAIHDVCSAIRAFPVPVVARVRGYCLGGGLEIAAACDLRVCDATAKFGMPEVRVGLPSVVEAALLPRLIGWGRTRELVYRGHVIDAHEAHRIGLVEQFTDGDIDTAVADVLADILEGGPQAIRLQKRLCRRWEQLAIDDAIVEGLNFFAQAYETDEPKRYCGRFFARKRDRG